MHVFYPRRWQHVIASEYLASLHPNVEESGMDWVSFAAGAAPIRDMWVSQNSSERHMEST